MLDFYLIKDDVSRPGAPELKALEYAGGLEVEVFEELQDKHIIAKQLSYWTDFRWSSQDVKQKFERLIENNKDLRENRLGLESAETKLFAILEKAVWAQYGLIAIAD
jgi:hypothetical protein